MKEKIKELLESLGYDTEDLYEDLVNALCIEDEREQILNLLNEDY